MFKGCYVISTSGNFLEKEMTETVGLSIDCDSSAELAFLAVEIHAEIFRRGIAFFPSVRSVLGPSGFPEILSAVVQTIAVLVVGVSHIR